MAKTGYAVAVEISREMQLDLNNGQVEELASFLGGFSDLEKAQRELLSKGKAEVREVVRRLRVA